MTPEHSANMELIFKIVAGRRKYMHAAADKLSVTWGRIPILLHIRHNSGCSQVHISNALGITPAAVAQMLPKMATDGLIVREADDSNHRANKLYITEKGNAVLKKGSELFDSVDNIMFDGVTAEESAQLFKIAGKIKSNLDRKLAEIGIGDRLDFSDTV